jgi:predicted ATP-grasp superfamily ATP-dependent carboligase/SAM-dependent methyltransferase
MTTGDRRPVVVFKAVLGRLPHSGIGVVRTLGRLGVPVHLVVDDPTAPIARSRYVRSVVRWDLGKEPSPTWIDALAAVADDVGGRPILIPTDDVGAIFVSDRTESLSARFDFPRQPDGVVRDLSSKGRLHALCTKLDIPTPAAAFPETRSDVEAFVADTRFPVVAKSIDPLRLPGGARGESVFIAGTETELLDYYDRVEVPGQPNLLLQEYIPGGPESVWMFNGYFDAEGTCRFGGTGRKLRQHPPYSGMSTLGVTVDNGDVRDLSMRLLSSIGYRGIVDMGLRFDARDGRYKMLDVNPRVGATFRLFVGEGGMDVVRALYLDLCGEPVPEDTVAPGRKWILETHDLASARTYVRDGLLTWPGWVRSLRGIREGAMFAADDPAPLARAVVRLTPRALAKALRRVRARPRSRAGSEEEESVSRRFHRRAEFWRDLYERPDAVGAMYRRREEMALEAVARGRGGPEPLDVLDLGCGAGRASVAMASRGFRVYAVDSGEAMLALTRDASAGLPTGARPRLARADATRLPFADGTFDIVFALGLLPWVERPDQVLGEVARLLRPGGAFVASWDNARRLSDLLDPLHVAAVRVGAGRAAVVFRRLRGRPTARSASARRDSPGQVRGALEAAGLRVEWETTMGFAPIKLAGRTLPFPALDRLSERLQRRSEAGSAVLRHRGNHVLVRAVSKG